MQDPTCTRSLWNGQTIETIDGGGFRVEATIRDTGWKTRADIFIVNHSGQLVDIHPEAFKLATVPDGKEVKYNDPDAMTRSIRRRADLGMALTSMGGSMQARTMPSQTTETGTATATGTGGMATGTYNGVSTTTTTGPDYEAQRRAANQVNQMRTNANSAIAYLQSIALLPNTVFPAHQIYGAVYFDRLGNHAKETLLIITVGSESFQFPFTVKRK
jgi:hypothetical protein